MENKYKLLTSPITIGRVTFRNRMFSAPMGATDITKDGCPGPRTPKFYELRAKGGAAAVTVSELIVDPKTDGTWMLRLDENSSDCLASHTYTADAINRHGAVSSIELSHSGQFAGRYMSDKEAVAKLTQYGPDDCIRHDGVPVKALSKEQIKDIVKAFGQKAALAKRAGYQMVLVHGGHGWLIHQFMSPTFNHRTDEYGGSFENRMRFAIEVLEEIRKNVGPGFPIEFRMSGSEFFDGGYDLDYGCKVAEAIEDYVDLIHVSAGIYNGFYHTHPPMFDPHGVNVFLAANIKKHVKRPVATIGAINDPAQMEEILESGKADVIYMARALLADPELPNKVCSGKDEQIIRCLRCFTCMAERPVTLTRRCAVNPVIGREVELIHFTPSAVKKKVLVIGAGPAGLQAAITASQRGHNVILCEKEDAAGGILKSEQGVSFKDDMFQLGRSLLSIAKDENIDIRMNTEVTRDYILNEAPDALIIATGSVPNILNIPGIDSDKVILVNDYYKNKDKVGNKIVVLGGGLSGCECAVHLGMEGKDVHIVVRSKKLAKDCNIRHRPILMQMVDKYVTVHYNTVPVAITESGVKCQASKPYETRANDESSGLLTASFLSSQELMIECDTVISATGQKANHHLADMVHGTVPQIIEIGDCTGASNITKAVYEGYHAGLDV